MNSGPYARLRKRVGPRHVDDVASRLKQLSSLNKIDATAAAGLAKTSHIANALKWLREDPDLLRAVFMRLNADGDDILTQLGIPQPKVDLWTPSNSCSDGDDNAATTLPETFPIQPSLWAALRKDRMDRTDADLAIIVEGTQHLSYFRNLETSMASEFAPYLDICPLAPAFFAEDVVCSMDETVRIDHRYCV